MDTATGDQVNLLVGSWIHNQVEKAKSGTWMPYYYPDMKLINHRPLYHEDAETLVQFGLLEYAKDADQVSI